MLQNDLWLEILWSLRLQLVCQHVTTVKTGGTGLGAKTAASPLSCSGGNLGTLQSLLSSRLETLKKREIGFLCWQGPTKQNNVSL